MNKASSTAGNQTVPDWKQEIRRRLADLQLAPLREAAIVEELAQHLDDYYAERRAGGATEDGAYHAVLAELSESELLQRELRRVEQQFAEEPVVLGTNRRSNMMADLWQDLRFGARMLLKKPGFTLIAVVTLALGIGANTALFTVFDALVLKPLPLKDPERIARIRALTREGRARWRFSYPDYLDYRAHNQVFEGLAAWNKVSVVLGDQPPVNDDVLAVVLGESEYVFGQIVSGNYFAVLGAELALGRGFVPEEDRTPGTHPVLVLSHGFWQRRFLADPDIIGKTIRLAGAPFTVVGVTAREFIGTEPDAPQFWAPLMMREQLIQAGGRDPQRWLTDRNSEVIEMVGRLRPGLSREQAAAQLSNLAEQLSQQFTVPEEKRPRRLELVRAATFIQIEPAMWPLIAPLPLAVGLILLIACTNVANLLLVRAATRQREIAVRLALGASGWRVIRQLLTESLLLAALGGMTGLLLTWWLLEVLYPVVMASLPLPTHLAQSFALNLSPDYRVFGFALLVSFLAGIVAGLAPALQAARPQMNSALKDEGSAFGAHLSQARLRNALVVTQLAVCLALLIGAGLLMRSLQKVQTIDTGMTTDNVGAILAGLATPPSEAHKEVVLRRQLLERLKTLPGVKSVSQADWQPLSGRGRATPITIPGHEPPRGRTLRATYNFVSGEYFETLGIRLTRGRAFTDRELQTNLPVALISEATAKRFWPHEDALGKYVGIGAAVQNDEAANANQTGENFPLFEVIGITRDTHSEWVWDKDETMVYLPLTAAAQKEQRRGEYMLVRTAGDPYKLLAEVQGAAAAVEPNLRITLRRLNDALVYQKAPFRAVASVAGALGLLALLLAAVGLYGAMSFVVAQRTREIGVRVALGAGPRDVIGLFMREGLKLVALGIVGGVLGGAGIARLLAAVLVELSPLDPVAFGAVSVFLAGVALLACYVPARRATRVDPLLALRSE